MFLTLRKKIADGAMVLLEGAGFVFSLCGASVVAFLGKLMLAAVLAAIALGFFLRLTGRRAPTPAPAASTPAWCYILSGILAAVEVALLAEATDLPVRFHQPGFELHHWLLVLVALLVAFVVHLQLFRAIRRKQSVLPQP